MKNYRNNLCQRAIFYMIIIMSMICMRYRFGTSMLVYAQKIEIESELEFGYETDKDTEFRQDEATFTDDQGIIYTYGNNQDCFISGYTQDIGSTIKIPVKISNAAGTYQVKGIRKSAFQDCDALAQVQIPNSVTDIASDAFSDCRNLKEISVLPVEYARKKSDKSSVTTVKIHSALLCTSAKVKLEIDETVMQQSVSDAKTDVVSLQIWMTAHDSMPVKKSLPAHMVLQRKAVKAIADSGKDFKVKVKDAEGSSYYIKVHAKDLRQLSGNLMLTLGEKEADDITGTMNADLKKACKKNGIHQNTVKILSYSFEKDSRTNIYIVFPVEGAKPGSNLYVYRYDKNKRVFAAISFHPHTVSDQGNITISVSKGGMFAVTKKKFQYMSRQPSDEFLTESSGTYYINKNGQAVHGWKKIGSEYYYFDRENGKMSVSSRIDGIKIQADGTAKQTEENVSKIQTMIKARAVVDQITDPTDSKSQKIEKCFRWVLQFPYRRYRRLKPIYRQPGWEITFANDIFDHHQGCCVSEASAVAFLFHECGYQTVYVACDTGHAWAELNGRVYDPLFAESREFYQYYNVPYAGYGMRPVLKRKI